MTKSSYLFVFLLLCSSSAAFAQGKRKKVEPKSEKEIRLEERFIAATREKALDNFDKADSILAKLTTDAADNSAVHFQWATVLYALKKYDKSLAQAELAQKLEPQNQTFVEFYAERLHDKGDYRKSAQVYEAFTKVEPGNKHIYLQEGLMWVKANEPENAIKAFNSLEKILGVTEETAKRKHVLYAALGKKDKAIGELTKLIERFPKEMEYRYGLAEFYENNGEPEKGLGVYRDILKVAPSDSRAMIALAKNAGVKRDEVEYVRALKGLFSRTDVTVENKIKQLLPYLEDANIAPKVMTEALACAEILAQTHPKDPQALSFYADLLYKTGNKQAALQQYQASVNADKKRFYAWQYILLLNTELKNFDEVARQAEIAADYFPNQPLVYYLWGCALFQQGKYAPAITQFEQALPMVGAKPNMRQDVYHQMARTYTALRQYDKAAPAWTEAMKDGGDKDPNTQEHFGDFLFIQGKTDEAVKAWQNAAKLGSLSPTLSRKIAEKRMDVGD